MKVNIFKIKQTTISWTNNDDGSKGDINMYTDEWYVITKLNYEQVRQLYTDFINDDCATHWNVSDSIPPFKYLPKHQIHTLDEEALC